LEITKRSFIKRRTIR